MSNLKESYSIAIAREFPSGEAWKAKDIQGSNLQKLIFSFAEIFNDIHCRNDDLLREIHPSTALEMLAEWENELYDDDFYACIVGLDPELQQRLVSVIAKTFAAGGNRPEYYQEIAEIFGFLLCITERTPNDFEAKFDLRREDDPEDPYTKPLAGSGIHTDVTGVAQSLSDLGMTLDPLAGRVRLVFDGLISDYKVVARYQEDGTLPTASVGHTIRSFDAIDLTREEAGTIELISTTGTIGVNITQYVREQYSLSGSGPCRKACGKLVTSEYDEEVQAFKCVVKTIMPAHLLFNIFVDGIHYDTIDPKL